MRYTEDLTKGQRTAQEKLIRRIVREEIVNALGALAREARDQDMPYEACDHTYDDSEGQPTDCITCGSPYPRKETHDGTS